MRYHAIILGASAFFAAGPHASPAHAQVPMTGRFIAEARCPATQAIETDPETANPGGVATAPGRSYALVGRNADPATHYHIRIPGSDPERRWVAVGCGRVEADSTVTAGRSDPSASLLRPTASDGASESGQAPAQDLVLAASWQTAFCETAPGRPECRVPHETRAAATRFTLHGLWPQPRGRSYCEVPETVEARDREGDWQALEPVGVSDAVRSELDIAMPGSLSALDRHEWVKHGTCYGSDPDDYFADALQLLKDVNDSRIQSLFAGAVGQYLADWQVARAFDRAFGQGSGARVEMVCRDDDGRQLITELRIHLSGRIGPDADLGRLMTMAPPVDSGCAGGVVDPEGLQ